MMPFSAATVSELLRNTCSTPRFFPVSSSHPANKIISRSRHLRANTVVREQVRATAQGASDTVRRTQRLESGRNSRRRGQPLQSLEIHSQTSNMGRGHGCARQARGRRVSANVARQDRYARCKDVNASAVVSKRSRAKARVSSSDSEGVGCVGGGLLGDGERVAILVAVTGSDDGEHALCRQLGWRWSRWWRLGRRGTG